MLCASKGQSRSFAICLTEIPPQLQRTQVTFPLLKDKSGVGIIVDHSRDYTVVNGM